MRDGDVFHIKDSKSWKQVLAAVKKLGAVESAAAHAQTYRFFDTFDWRLHNANLSAQIITVGNASDAALIDSQTNNVIARQAGLRQFGMLEDGLNATMHKALAGVIEMRALMPLATVNATSQDIALRNEDDKIICRMSLDDCRLPADDAGEEKELGLFLTLKPVKGYDKACNNLRETLSDPKFECRQMARQLHLIAFEALGLHPGSYSSKLQLELSPHTSAVDAVRKIHLTLLDTMQQNEDGTLSALDTEFLHDFRVAIRRTRSALTLIDKNVLPAERIQQAKDDFKWIGGQTNRMRDLDVYLLDYEDLRSSLADSFQDHLKPFQSYLTKESKKEARRVRALINSDRYKAICADWRHYLQVGYLSGPLPETAQMTVKQLADERIWKAYRRVRREGGTLTPQNPAEDLHNFRITCKKLRYLMEFFQSLYPADEIGKLIKSLKAFQNVLGDFQDTEVQSKAIVEMGREMANAKAAPVETQMAMGMVADSILQKQGKAREAFHARFDAFAAPEIDALFKDLFKAGV